MDKLVLEGPCRLEGEVEAGGAKNAALPLLFAALLTDEPCVIRNLPALSDVSFMGQIMQSLGAEDNFGLMSTGPHNVAIRAVCDRRLEAGDVIVGEITPRASVNAQTTSSIPPLAPSV